MISRLGLKGEHLRARSIRSALLTGFSFGASNLLRLGGNLVLTRLLFPEAFGIMALVQVVMAGLNMFSDVGIRASIIQNARGEDPVFQDTAWMMQVGRGILLWLATWAMAAPVAAFYEVPILAEILPVVGLVALFQGFNSTKLILANRNLMLGRVTVIQIASNALGLVVLIALAMSLGTVWALAIGTLAAPFLLMVLSHVALPGRNNRIRFELRAARDLVGFGKFIFLSTLAGFLIAQADRAILGKFVTLTDLALYNIAFMFAAIPVQVMRKMNDTVLFPLYSRKPPGESLQNFRNIAKARWLVLAVIMSFLAVMAIFGNQMIIALYDPRYEAAGVLVVLIALASTSQVVVGGYGSMMLAAGDSRQFAVLMICSAALRTAVLFWAVVHYGLVGAALSPLVSTVLFYPVMIRLLRPYGGWVPAQDMVFSLAACAIAGVALWVNQDALRTGLAAFGFTGF